jgi:ribosomal protein S18 acetylase RimI-like enzyme
MSDWSGYDTGWDKYGNVRVYDKPKKKSDDGFHQQGTDTDTGSYSGFGGTTGTSGDTAGDTPTDGDGDGDTTSAEDVQNAIDEFNYIVDNTKRKIVWELNADGVSVPIMKLSTDGGQTWADDPTYDFSKAAEIVHKVGAAITAFKPFDGSAELADLDRLIKLLKAGPTDQDERDAENRAARMLGLDSGQALFDYKAQLLKDMSGVVLDADGNVVSGGTGLTQQEKDTFREANRAANRLTERWLSRQLENIMSERGSTTVYLQAADSARAQISDQRARQEIDLLAADLGQRQQHFENLQERYKYAADASIEIQQHALTELRNNRVAAMQGMSLKISSMVEIYKADAQVLGQWVDNMYRSMEMQLGLEEHVLDQMDDAFEREIRPHVVKLENLSAEAEIDAFEAAKDLAEEQLQQLEDQTPIADTLISVGLGLLRVPGLNVVGGIMAGLALLFKIFK